MHQLRKAGQDIDTIQSEGVTYHLKVASWETAGAYEVWEMVFDKGLEVHYHEHHASFETFYVTKGSVEVTLANKTFIAKSGDLVHVPPYMPHSMVFQEEGTTFMAYFYNFKFYNVMQERMMLKEHNPEILEDEAFSKEFGDRHDSHKINPPMEVV
jgi:quercetin dioxygenase-like cupin family protein